MKRSLMSLLLALALVSLYMPAFADESSSDSMEDVNNAIGALTQKVDALAAKGPAVEFHGFVQSDMINDSTQSFAETVGDGSVKQGGSVNGANGLTQFSLRNSRIDLLAKDSTADWNFKGYIETDFLGIPNGDTVNGNEYKLFTQPTLRLRHAYVEGDTNDGWMIMAGQYWTLFGWNMDYVLATVAEAPVMATLYERIPQLRIQKTLGDNKGAQLQIAAALEKPDQDASQTPNVDFGIRFLMNDIKGRFCSSTGAGKLMPLSIGLSERNADFYWNANGGQTLNQNIWASALAADIMLPVMPASEGKDDPSIVITGEYTYGAGDTMPFNGGGFSGLAELGTDTTGVPASYTTLSGVTSQLYGSEAGVVNGGLTPILLQSYNAQIQIFLPPSIGTIFTAGYGEIFASNTGAFTVAGDTVSVNDDSNMFVNVMQDLNKEVRVGLEYSQYWTHYTAAANNNPTDQRLQLSTWYRF
jgi:hypothetical protein